jgi:hypothetical protein
MRLRLSCALLGAAVAVLSAQPSLAQQKAAPKPMFLVLPAHGTPARQAATVAAHLPQWNGSFVDHLGQTVTYTMVGGDPAKTNVASSVRVFIIPVKMVYGANNGNATFDPLTATLPNGQTLIQNVLASPLLTRSIRFVQGKTNLGLTQYIDAFQRANFWSSVKTNTAYHVLLANPTVLPEQTINVPVQDGQVTSNPFGSGNVGTMYVNDFDTAIQGFIAKLTKLNPGVLPLFLTYDVYLTQAPLEGCCIGGYHSAIGSQPSGQTYAYTTYEDSVARLRRMSQPCRTSSANGWTIPSRTTA